MTLEEVVDAIREYRVKASLRPRDDDFGEAFNVGLDSGLEWCLLMLDKVVANPPKQNWDQP